MAECLARGRWVEIHRVVLAAGHRAPHVPEETRRVPLEMRVKGFLLAPAVVGDELEIATRAGRRVRGTLTDATPAYSHTFGPLLPELSTIGEEVRAVLRER